MTDHTWQTIHTFLEILLQLMSANIVGWLTLFVLTLTLIILCYYTYYTYRLNQTAEKQTEEIIKQRRLSILPSFQIFFIEGDVILESKPPKIHLHNVGNGVALNITIIAGFLDKQGDSGNTDLVNVLNPGDSVRLFDSPFCPVERRRFVNSRVVFIFYDIEGNKYEQKTTLTHGRSKHFFVKPLTVNENE